MKRRPEPGTPRAPAGPGPRRFSGELEETELGKAQINPGGFHDTVLPDVGGRTRTARRYLNLLETSFLAVRVEPFAANRTKRVVKTPKPFWSDTGLGLHVAGETEPRGAHLENLVLTDLGAWKDARRGSPQILYWRTYDGREVDFVLESDGEVVAVEVKATARPRPRDWSTLLDFRDRYRDEVKGCVLLHDGERTEWVSDRVLAVPWWRVL